MERYAVIKTPLVNMTGVTLSLAHLLSHPKFDFVSMLSVGVARVLEPGLRVVHSNNIDKQCCVGTGRQQLNNRKVEILPKLKTGSSLVSSEEFLRASEW